METVMNNGFDLDNANKRMPYTISSDDFFDKLEENIWKEVKGDYLGANADNAASFDSRIHRKPSKLRIVAKYAIAVAASVALVFFVNMNMSKQSKVSLNDIDQAFSQLSSDDQSYLLNVYQDDVFINE